MLTDPTLVATRATRPRAVEELSIPTLLALHIVPGALMTLAFIAFAPVAQDIGFPPIAALLVAIVVVLVPVELGIMWRAAASEGVRFLDVIPYRRPIRPRDWLWLVPALIALAFLGFGLHMAIEPTLIDRFFGWLPEWFVKPISVDRVGEYSSAVWVVTIAAFFAVNGFLGPIVEELYFRGYLLPRMARFGRWAPLINVSLFSLYHFWSPWQLMARILGLGPTVYAARWTRNVYLGMVVHCSLNTLGVLTVALLVFGRL
jgi:membrane protease YdiL (CAAX protease family)